jgi:hypothetical protein
MRRTVHLIGLVVAALLAGNVGGVWAQATATAPATAPTNWPELVISLSSRDYLVREAAQGQLDRLPVSELKALQKAAETATDPEAKARLIKAASDLEVRKALDLPRISFDLKDGSLDDLVAAVNRSAGVEMLSVLAGADRRRKLTMKGEDLPFWDVIGELQKHYFVLVQPDVEPLQLRLIGGKQYQICGPFLLDPMVQQGVFAVAGGAPMQGVALRVTGITDPRLSLVKTSMRLQLQEAVDDAGNSLVAAPTSGDERMIMGSIGPAWVATAMLGLAPGSKEHAGATKLTRVKGSVLMVIAVETDKFTLEDVEQKAGTPIDTALGPVMLQRIDRVNGNLRVMATLGQRWNNAGRESGDDNEMVMLRSYDGDGKILCWNVIQRMGASSTSRGLPVVGKVKMDVTVVKRTKEVYMPIELKDIPYNGLVGVAGGR